MKVMAVDRVESYRAKMTPERCSSIMMPIPETLMQKNEADEPSLVFNVSPGEAIVQRVWIEYDVEMTVQMNHINWSERGLIESAVVRLNHDAAAASFERKSAERTMISSEGCSFILEVSTELSQRTDETWEVGSGKCPIQELECFQTHRSASWFEARMREARQSERDACAKDRSREAVARSSDLCC